MQKKAIILDLDNTIYPVAAIANKLFKTLFALIEESGAYKGNLAEIKNRIMRQPFQVVARDFSFSEDLVKDCLQLLGGLTYESKMEPFEGYETVRNIACKKFLVTTGFTKLQHSKINQLGIDKDFEAIFVVDPSQSALTKKDIFRKILDDYRYTTDEVLVVGDDLHSEIRAAKELGIETVLYNHNGEQPPAPRQNTIHSFKEIIPYLQ
ncbi:HAD family hydrolase [Agriterribacter sp.]|uniref:HAD family hydrolase n=1 Tax=Agriterribacter sp. TaxID=2821509 RepID=UPI002BBFB7DB|nr:HAD family hydrolase [Agriterribacter sp.]HRP56410.1 HAD family hydrolase [Agriterribacter sp.]